MYYPKNIETIKKQLNAQLFIEELQAEALTFVSQILTDYKRKNIDKYLKDEINAKSPKIKNAKSGHEYARFSIGIYKDYFFNVNVYFYPVTPQNFQANGSEHFLFNDKDEKTPAGLKKQIDSRLDGIKEKIKTLKESIKNIEKIKAKYDKLHAEAESFDDSLCFYVKDQLSGKSQYGVQFYNNN